MLVQAEHPQEGGKARRGRDLALALSGEESRVVPLNGFCGTTIEKKAGAYYGPPLAAYDPAKGGECFYRGGAAG
jgi:hypothetical protein